MIRLRGPEKQDGRVWLNPHDEEVGTDVGCDGLARFDGVDLLRNGSVWVPAGADYWEEENPPVETYVIPAEVAMADR